MASAGQAGLTARALSCNRHDVLVLKLVRPPFVAGLALALGLRRGYRLLASGALTLDLDVGRRLQPLGPVDQPIAAPREVVFDVIAAPYLGRTPRALADKLEVWERGSDMVLAAHFTQVKCGTTITLETVRFERPQRIDFRLVRGPVPHLAESFLLIASDGGTRLRWEGELGTDVWALGEWWGGRVARAWERAVRASLREIAAEAERRAGHRRRLVEILYFDGCPNHQETRELVERVSDELGLRPELRLVDVEDEDAARRLRFLGSPTVRVDGRDVEPHADERGDYALACRVYRTESGLAGQPDEAWVRAALQRDEEG
jgi:hypothetical protein